MAWASRSGRSRAHCSTIASTPSRSATNAMLAHHSVDRYSLLSILQSRIIPPREVAVMTVIAARPPITVPRPPHLAWGLAAGTAVAPATWGTTYAVTTEWLPPDRPL